MHHEFHKGAYLHWHNKGRWFAIHLWIRHVEDKHAKDPHENDEDVWRIKDWQIWSVQVRFVVSGEVQYVSRLKS